MSGEYFQWVLPEPSRLDYLPSGDVVASMLAEMASVGWLVSPLPELRIRRPVDGKPESLRLPVSDLAATVEQTIATHGAGFVELPLAEPAEEVDDDVPYDTISAERCYAGNLLIAANLSAVHSDGWQEGFLACPECSADVAAVVVPEASPSLWRSFSGQLPACRLHRLPVRPALGPWNLRASGTTPSTRGQCVSQRTRRRSFAWPSNWPTDDHRLTRHSSTKHSRQLSNALLASHSEAWGAGYDEAAA